MKIYVAASFAYEDKEKTESRKKKIEEVVERVKRLLPGDYYLPHTYKVPNAWDISLQEWSKAVYEHDIQQLDKSDLILFLSFGKENNSGSVWEIGYASAIKKYRTNLPGVIIYPSPKIICVKMTEEPESLMISNSVDAIIPESQIDSYDWINIPSIKVELKKVS